MSRFFSMLGRFLALALSVLVISFGAWGLLRQAYYTHYQPPLDPKKVVTKSVDTPSEVEITQDTDYVVDANKPRQISIPSLGLSAYIQQVGVDQNHRVAVPDNVSLAGWYVDSVLPGQDGLSIVDGHVYAQYSKGAFYDLNRLVVGDRIIIENGDRLTNYNFMVKKIFSVPDSQATELLFRRDRAITAQLNLITCASYNKSTKKYDNRLIIVAERI